MDFREMYLNDVTQKLLKFTDDQKLLSNVLNAITSSLEDYELTARSTEVGFHYTYSEELLKLYAGTLLTEGQSQNTVYNYIQFLRRFADDIQMRFVDVRTMDIRIWLAKAQETVSLRSCENYRAYLSAFYTWLTAEEYIDKNPMLKIKPIKYEEEKEPPFTDIELDALRTLDCTTRDRAIVELLVSSGIRVAELCALNISDIDFTAKKVTIKKGKGNKFRITYMTDLCALYLKKYLRTRTDDSECLFLTRNHTRLTTDAARNLLKALGDRAGIENVHPHRFRKTFATEMSRKGMDIKTIQRLLGHTNINTTMGYITLNDALVNYEYQKYA